METSTSEGSDARRSQQHDTKWSLLLLNGYSGPICNCHALYCRQHNYQYPGLIRMLLYPVHNKYASQVCWTTPTNSPQVLNSKESQEKFLNQKKNNMAEILN